MKQYKLFPSLLAAAVIVIGCGVGSDSKATAEATTAAADKPAAPAAATVATGGAIKGTIKFEGTAPKRKRLNLNADPACASAHSSPVLSEDILVSAAGELANVVVSIAEVPGDHPKPTTAAVIDQKGCLYEPRIVVVQEGQTLEIKNSDKTLHNVHCYKGTATCFNRAMFQGMPPIKHNFTEKGDVVKFKCDVHPWMTAYAFLATNPFTAVSAKDGTFEIKGLPAGEYTVKFWHEKLGEQTKQVKVSDTAGASVDVSFKAAS